MPNDYLENLTKLSQSLIKPMKDLTELNTKTLSRLAKNELLEDALKAKKPEEFLSAQTKLVNVACMESLKHTQEAFEILMNAATESNKIIEEIVRKATVKSADIAQTGINKVKEKAQGQQG
ncbi:MAG: phasin family protein [Gammaproteobacteria bacterium]|nr:phasin family protein [Gammaproteobacteria bacterium]